MSIVQFKHGLVSAALACSISAAIFAVAAHAEPNSDEMLIRRQVAAFYDAVAARDVDEMQKLWATDAKVTMITPRQKRTAIGWPAVKRAFVEGVFTFWNAFDALPADTPLVVIDGAKANAMFSIDAVGENSAREVVHYTIRNSQIFEKRGDRWLLIGSFATGRPE